MPDYCMKLFIRFENKKVIKKQKLKKPIDK